MLARDEAKMVMSRKTRWTAKWLVLCVAIFVVTACDDGVVEEGGTEDDDTEEIEGPTYENPVLNRDFPDPTVIEGPDGQYYAYGTETMIDGEPYNIQVAQSEDLVDWSWEGDALPDGAPWAEQERTYWAPHVLYAPEQEQYIMYYSAHHDERDSKCLAVATSTSPLGPFEDKGEPLLCGEGFVNIDPMAFDDPVSEKKLLYWGSDFEPIRVQELDDDRMRFKSDSEPTEVLAPDPDEPYSNLIEGAWVIYRDDTYFMFYSGDNCCGESANYAVMVARAEDPLGPFERLSETRGTNRSTILEANATWNAPGHNSVVQDAAGDDWMVYHAIDREQPRRETGIPGVQWDRRVMLMDRIEYVNDWPRIEKGQPSEISPVPAVDDEP